MDDHPDKYWWSRVFYSVEAAMPSWLPLMVVGAIKGTALTQATAWVKTESEKRAPPGFDSPPDGMLSAFSAVLGGIDGVFLLDIALSFVTGCTRVHEHEHVSIGMRHMRPARSLA